MGTLTTEHGVNSFKHFMAYKNAIMCDDAQMIESFECARDLGAICLVHAENGDLVHRLQQETFDRGIHGPEGHPISRPPEVEGEAANRACQIAAMVGVPLYVVHTSCRQAMEAIARAKMAGHRVFGESLVQHLVIDDSAYRDPDWRRAAHHVMSPPFRSADHQRTLWGGLQGGTIEVIGTDLFLKAGISLDYETKASYSLTLSASDPLLPGSNPVSTAFALGLISLIAPPPSAIWDLPGSNPSSVATWAGNPSQVDGSKPVQAGGIGNTWTTTDAPAGSTNQVVLSGKNNTLNVGAGQAQIQSIGQGNAIEAVQQLGDATKIISTGSFGAGTESPPPPIVNAAASTTGNVIGQIATIDEMAGGMTPGSGFYSYATGGTGNDLLYGSVFSDFFRGGMGNDTIIAYAGNDIVRGGAGSDQITLGSGNDTIYYTFDQLQDGDIDTVTDFNAIAGEVDILAIQADRVGGAGNYGSFRGFGTNSLSITDSDGSVTTVVAQAGYQWKQADIFFGV